MVVNIEKSWDQCLQEAKEQIYNIRLAQSNVIDVIRPTNEDADELAREIQNKSLIQSNIILNELCNKDGIRY